MAKLNLEHVEISVNSGCVRFSVLPDDEAKEMAKNDKITPFIKEMIQNNIPVLLSKERCCVINGSLYV